jgi:hypothetical protein
MTLPALSDPHTNKPAMHTPFLNYIYSIRPQSVLCAAYECTYLRVMQVDLFVAAQASDFLGSPTSTFSDYIAFLARELHNASWAHARYTPAPHARVRQDICHQLLPEANLWPDG